MSNDPLIIHIDRLVELLRGFGLDPVNPKDIRSVTIEGGAISVVRYRRDENGRQVIAGDELATETVTIRLEHNR